jgi:hypothetical protein
LVLIYASAGADTGEDAGVGQVQAKELVQVQVKNWYRCRYRYITGLATGTDTGPYRYRKRCRFSAGTGCGAVFTEISKILCSWK